MKSFFQSLLRRKIQSKPTTKDATTCCTDDIPPEELDNSLEISDTDSDVFLQMDSDNEESSREPRNGCIFDEGVTGLIEEDEIYHPSPPHEEHQYLNLIREIIANGSYETSRNGNTYTKFGHQMRFSLRDGKIPILTTKRVAWRVCFEELFWFIRGSTSNLELQAKKVHIWDANASRKFLDGRGLYDLNENDLGPIYGFQWRHFNAPYDKCEANYSGEGIDQLQYIIDQLKNPETRTSRRLVMTAWNPCQIQQMALPPCHVLAQFHVRDGKYLSCALYQRSGDVGLGVPFNIASYSLLTHILAKHCDLEADDFVHFLGNCHIYEQHIDALKMQLEKLPKKFPKITIREKRDNIEAYHLEDICWTTPYCSHEPIKMDMVA